VPLAERHSLKFGMLKVEQSQADNCSHSSIPHSEFLNTPASARRAYVMLLQNKA
jgi:hypothetical protein